MVFFDPLPPLCPPNLYCLSAYLGYFLTPPMFGRHIWKPPKTVSYLPLDEPALGTGLPLAVDIPQVGGQQPLVRQHEAALHALVPL